MPTRIMPPATGRASKTLTLCPSRTRSRAGGQAGRSGPDHGHLFSGRLRVVLEGRPDDGFVAHIRQFMHGAA